MRDFYVLIIWLSSKGATKPGESFQWDNWIPEMCDKTEMKGVVISRRGGLRSA